MLEPKGEGVETTVFALQGDAQLERSQCTLELCGLLIICNKLPWQPYVTPCLCIQLVQTCLDLPWQICLLTLLWVVLKLDRVKHRLRFCLQCFTLTLWSLWTCFSIARVHLHPSQSAGLVVPSQTSIPNGAVGLGHLQTTHTHTLLIQLSRSRMGQSPHTFLTQCHLQQSSNSLLL